MKLSRFFSILLILIFCLTMTPVCLAQENNNTETNSFMNGLMSILQESIDDFIGSYKGSLGDVKLIERLGNKVVLEVSYNNVKRSDNVYVQGEVRYLGTPLEGFSNTLNAVTGRNGKVRLAIGWSSKDDDGWGMVGTEVKSDQIRLFLVRKSNPDRPFGEIIYDISKTWTHSDEPDEPSMASGDDYIELEDNTPDSTNKPQPGIFIKPGTILMPVKKHAVPGVSTAAPAPGSNPGTARPVIQDINPPKIVKTAQKSSGLTNYDFYKNAKSAKWRSSAGILSFPGSGNDKKGFVRHISKGRLNSGNVAVSMLETHPQFKPDGWIDAHYPMMILSDNLRFKSIAGFLKGADSTDGATFQVYIKKDNKYYKVFSRRVSARRYVTINADLSKWAGKKVQIVLRVLAGKTSDQDWAVWVKPRLSR